MELSTAHHKPRHAIGIVARRTGLRPDLIRAWERRYRVVEPARSETRRRLYSDVQVERLRLLRRAVDRGWSIGDVAGLGDGEIRELIAEDLAEAAVEASRRDGMAVAGDRVEAALVACEEAILGLDQDGLTRELERASVALSRPHLLERLIGPLLDRVGRAWREGRLRPVQEHMASAVIRSFVGGLIVGSSTAGAERAAPRVVVATPPGQSHELGALLVAASAASEGWRAVYVGAEVAAEEIGAAVSATAARVVALSIIYPPDDPSLPRELERLGNLLPSRVALLVGGRGAPAYRAAVEAAGGVLVGDLGAFRLHLVEARDG